MKQIPKRFLALLLCAAMLFSLMPVMAFADPAYVAQIGDVKYKTLDDAIEAAESGNTLLLLSDVDLSSVAELSNSDTWDLVFPAGVSLDLGGKTLTVPMSIKLSGDISVKNGTVRQWVPTSWHDDKYDQAFYETYGRCAIYHENGSMSIEKLTVHASGCEAVLFGDGNDNSIASTCTIYGEIRTEGNLVVQGGTYRPSGPYSDDYDKTFQSKGVFDHVANGKTLTINGGDYEAIRYILASATECHYVINGGQFKVTGPEKWESIQTYAFCTTYGEEDFYLNGGRFWVPMEKNATKGVITYNDIVTSDRIQYAEGKCLKYVGDGWFEIDPTEGCAVRNDMGYYFDTLQSAIDNDYYQRSTSGNTFKNFPTFYLLSNNSEAVTVSQDRTFNLVVGDHVFSGSISAGDDYLLTSKDATYNDVAYTNYSIGRAFAKNETTVACYLSLKEAVQAASNNDTIKLLTDVLGTSPAAPTSYITVDKPITIDLDGHTYSVKDGSTAKLFEIRAAAKIMNGSIIGRAASGYGGSVFDLYNSSANLTLNGVSVTNTYAGTNAPVTFCVDANNVTLNINNGEGNIISGGAVSFYNAGYNLKGTITGGTFDRTDVFNEHLAEGKVWRANADGTVTVTDAAENPDAWIMRGDKMVVFGTGENAGNAVVLVARSGDIIHLKVPATVEKAIGFNEILTVVSEVGSVSWTGAKPGFGVALVVTEPDEKTTVFTTEVTAESAVASVTAGETVTYYASLEDALAAAQNDNTVTLLKSFKTDTNILIDKPVTIDLNGCKITSSVGGDAGAVKFQHASGTVTIIDGSDAKIGGIDGEKNIFTDDYKCKGSVCIKGGTYRCNMSGTASYPRSTNLRNATTTIEGGTFYGSLYLSKGNKGISGGLFDNPPSTSYVADGLYVLPTENDMYMVGPLTEESAVAKVGDDLYPTLSDAFYHVANDHGKTIVLLKNTKEDIGVYSCDEVILDLNGHTLSAVDSCALEIWDGVVTIKDSSVEKSGKIIGYEDTNAIYVSDATLNIEGGTISGGEYCATVYAWNGNVNITGGSVLSAYARTVYVEGESSLSISDGSFNKTLYVGNDECGTSTGLITGGYYIYDVSDYVSVGYICITLPDTDPAYVLGYTHTVLPATITRTYHSNYDTDITYTDLAPENYGYSLAKNNFTRVGYDFLGWATEAEGEVVYEDGALVTLSANEDLYAVWKAYPVQPTEGTVGEKADVQETETTEIKEENKANIDVEEGKTFDDVVAALNGIGVNGDESLQKFADENVTELIKAVNSDTAMTREKAEEILTEKSISTDGELITTIVQPYLTKEVVGYKVSADGQEVTMDIKAFYNVLVTTDPDNMITSGAGQNTVVYQEEVPLDTLGTDIVIDIDLKDEGISFDPALPLYVKHTHGDVTYLYDATLTDGGVKIHFTNGHGFSEFVLTQKIEGIVAKIGDVCYEKLAAAVKAVQDNQTIILLANCSEEIEVSEEVSFKLDTNGKEFTGSIKAAEGYFNDGSGNSFVIKPYACHGERTLDMVEEGSFKMYFGKQCVGTYTFEKVSGGWYIKDVNGNYIGRSSDSLINAKQLWQYSYGKFFQTETISISRGWVILNILFGRKTSTTDYYLALDGKTLGVNTTALNSLVTLKEEFLNREHDFGYRNTGTGTHEHYCIDCGYVDKDADTRCVYNKDGYCELCGGMNPSVSGMFDFNVKVKSNNFLFFKLYTADVLVTSKIVGIKSVSVSPNTRIDYNKSTKILSTTPINVIYIAITDFSGNVYTYVYDGATGRTTPDKII